MSRGYIDGLGEPADEDSRRTFDSFGYEWTTFSQVNPEDERFWKRYVAGVNLGELSDRVGLDAGCGKGHYTRFLAPHLEALFALDGSDAVTAAATNLSHFDNVAVVKSDLRAPPVAEASLGFVSCLGVLHHLADPEAGFRALVRLLADDGILLVYLYSRPTSRDLRSLALAAASGLRRVTVRLPHPLLRTLSAPVAGALYATFVLPGRVGDTRAWPRLAALPLDAYRGQPVRTLWLDTFDRLSAPLECRYTWAEIEPWFTRAGLTVEHVSERSGLTIVARRARSASARPGYAAKTTVEAHGAKVGSDYDQG